MPPSRVPPARDPAPTPLAGLGITLIFAIIASHALAETARDALFLRDLPAERLPWAYLAIAGGVLASSRLIERSRAYWSRAQLLRGLLLVGASGHLLFGVLATRRSAGVLLALYVWCGVLTSLLVVQLWLMLAEAIDVGGAKRAFARIGAGGVAGAAAGGTAAVFLLMALPVAALLTAAAGVLLVAALLSLRLPQRAAQAAAAPAAELPQEPATVRSVLADRYAARILLAVALLAALGTGVDFLFKKIVAQEIAPERLGQFFAYFHAASNAGALLVQVAVTPWLLQHLGVTRALLVLPALLGIGAGSLAATGRLVPALAAKLADGVLNESLHRAAGEILYLPVGEPMRGTLRALAASLGQRSGQALASFCLLAATAAAMPPQVVGGVAAALAAALFVVVLGLEKPYVERFRASVRSLGRDAPREVPRLDLRALESLVAALSSPDPDEVVASIDLLEAYEKHRLVPPLVLYHPAPRVVVRALALFRAHPAPGIDLLVPWLLSHPEAEVRAAALRTRAAVGAEVLETLLLEDPAPAVRAAALAELAERDLLSPEREQEALAWLLAHPGASLSPLARAVAALPAERGLPWMEKLARHSDPAVHGALAEELALAPIPRYLPLLLDLLAHPDSREAARGALCALSRPALDALSEALRNPATPPRVRRHLPRSISRFPEEAASRLLTDALASEQDPRVRYKILRGLGRMRSDRPHLAVDPKPLAALAELSLQRAVEMIAFQVAVQSMPRSPRGESELLGRLLLEKEERAVELVFRALHILEPTLEFRALFEALRAEDEPVRAAAREVLEHVVEAPLRDAVLAVVSSGSAKERLAGALRFHAPEGAERLLEALRAEDGVAPSSVLEEAWRAMEADEDPVLAAVATRARREDQGVPHGAC